MRRIVSGAAALLLLALPGGAFANMLADGSFNTTTPLNQYGMIFVTPSLNAHALTGWTITAGSIDIVPNSVLQAAPGSRFSLDMIGTPSLVHGTALGSIQQTAATVADTEYTLSFDFTVNPTHTHPLDEVHTTKVLLVQAIGEDGHTVLASQTFSDTAGTRTAKNMQWALENFTFTADGQQATIVLSALTPLGLPNGILMNKLRTGPMIDNLDLEVGGGGESPEPASLSLLGLGGMLLLRRRSRT